MGLALPAPVKSILRTLSFPEKRFSHLTSFIQDKTLSTRIDDLLSGVDRYSLTYDDAFSAYAPVKKNILFPSLTPIPFSSYFLRPTLFVYLRQEGREATLVYHAPCVLCILYCLGINDRDVAGS